MRPKSLNLVVTDLLCPEGAGALPSLPAAETVLARGRVTRIPSVIESIGRAFGLNQQDVRYMPYGGITRLGDTGSWEPQGWLRADPVHLHADATTLLLFDQAMLKISMAEATALAACFEDVYGAEGYLLETPVATRWYMRMPDIRAFHTTPLRNAVGRNLHVTMPGGADSRKLRALMNELQMLFHEHPVNRARAAAGRPAINGIWLWGEGSCVPRTLSYPGTVYAQDPWSRGLACLAGTRTADVPSDARAWLDHPGVGTDLIVLDEEAGRPRSEAADRKKNLEKLEADWFSPLVDGLLSGRITQLLVDPGNGCRYHLTRRQLRRFWRRRRSLKEYV